MRGTGWRRSSTSGGASKALGGSGGGGGRGGRMDAWSLFCIFCHQIHLGYWVSSCQWLQLALLRVSMTPRPAGCCGRQGLGVAGFGRRSRVKASCRFRTFPGDMLSNLDSGSGFNVPPTVWATFPKAEPNTTPKGQLAVSQNHGIPFWGRCTTHFSLVSWGLGCSLGVRGFDPWPVGSNRKVG